MAIIFKPNIQNKIYEAKQKSKTINYMPDEDKDRQSLGKKQKTRESPSLTGLCSTSQRASHVLICPSLVLGNAYWQRRAVLCGRALLFDCWLHHGSGLWPGSHCATGHVPCQSEYTFAEVLLGVALGHTCLHCCPHKGLRRVWWVSGGPARPRAVGGGLRERGMRLGTGQQMEARG